MTERITNDKRSKSDPVGKELRRVWGETPVVDAKKDLRIFIRQEDILAAKKKDAGECVFAQACRRMFNSSKVMFFKSVAYIELPDEKGNKKVERYLMPKEARRLIENFDRGNPIIPEGGFLLTAPPPSKTLNGKREIDRERKMSTTYYEGIFGRKTTAKNKRGKTSKPITIDLTVRRGTGKVRFIENPSEQFEEDWDWDEWVND